MKRSKPNKRKRKKMSRWLFMFFLIITFTGAMGMSYFYFKGKFAFESSYIADIGLVQDEDSSEGRDGDPSRLYESKKSSPVIRSGTVFRKDALLFVAEDIIKKNMEPYKVRLLDLYMDREGIVYIDFGGELKNNFMGDATEELRMIAGLYNGIRFKVPGFTALKILINGKETESFGGHIDISRPIGEEIAENI
ncbi:MAG: GerMN domain-containing protein [Nitrospira sp.]|nr:GerMN domain-containing protein [Nitrospira sp.]